MLFAQVYRTRLTTSSAVLRISAFATSSRKYSNTPVPNKSKIWASVDEAVKDVKSGDVLLCGGQHALLLVSSAESEETNLRIWIGWHPRSVRCCENFWTC
jgi:hypothetical protein